MKRSEMVKTLIVAIYKGPHDFIMDYDDASEVLAELEKAGMLPPKLSVKQMHPIYGIEYTISANQWEEE